MKKIHVPPLSRWIRFLDWILVPVMYFVSGTLSEKPQRTHRWNNTKLSIEDVRGLHSLCMVHSAGVLATERWRWKIPIFHLPLFGGWKQYVVLEPASPHITAWHVGWVTLDVRGVSRIVDHGPVRVLLGPQAVAHFGIDARTGSQIALRKVGTGAIGDEGSFCHIPLS